MRAQKTAVPGAGCGGRAERLGLLQRWRPAQAAFTNQCFAPMKGLETLAHATVAGSPSGSLCCVRLTRRARLRGLPFSVRVPASSLQQTGERTGGDDACSVSVPGGMQLQPCSLLVACDRSPVLGCAPRPHPHHSLPSAAARGMLHPLSAPRMPPPPPPPPRTPAAAQTY